VRGWIERHAAHLGDDVLEVGSRIHDPRAWWLVNRDLARGQWTGIDMQAGEGVDRVADLHALPEEWTGRFSGAVCSEVLEHVARPWRALPELRRVLQPGALVIVTAPSCFPLHAFPDDFYRYSESGLRVLLEDAGFVDIETASGGRVDFKLDDHGGGRLAQRSTPMHVFAVARAAALPFEAEGEPCSSS
jgi:SAM-dependent methyltransferase